MEGEATTGRDRETLLLMSSKNAEIHHPVSDGHLSSRPTLEADEVDEGEEKVSEAERAPIHTDTPGPLWVINGFTILEISWEQRSRIRSGVKTKGRSPPPLVAVPPLDPIRSRFHDTRVFTIDPPRPSGGYVGDDEERRGGGQ